MRQLFHSRSYAYHVLPPFHKTWVLSTGRRIVQRQVFLSEPSTSEMLSVCSKTQLDIHVRAIFNWALNSRFHWFCFTLLCDWSRKLAPLSRPIRCKPNTNHDLVARVFPPFLVFRAFYFLPMLLWLLRFWSEMRFDMNTVPQNSPLIRLLHLSGISSGTFMIATAK